MNQDHFEATPDFQSQQEIQGEIRNQTANIISAYVTGNRIPKEELPDLILSVHQALSNAVKPVKEEVILTPAVSIKKSITPEYIICLEDGKQFKSLKRHLKAKYNMTADEYRAKWNLPDDYPMVAPNYSMKRSSLALKMGLGQSASREANEASNNKSDSIEAISAEASLASSGNELTEVDVVQVEDATV